MDPRKVLRKVEFDFKVEPPTSPARDLAVLRDLRKRGDHDLADRREQLINAMWRTRWTRVYREEK